MENIIRFKKYEMKSKTYIKYMLSITLVILFLSLNIINFLETKKINNFKGDINDKDEINIEKFYSTIEFLNKTPVPMKYKNIKLLGDKVRLAVLDDEKSQEMAYLSLGVGLGEMNSRGAGFVNYRWL